MVETFVVAFLPVASAQVGRDKLRVGLRVYGQLSPVVESDISGNGNVIGYRLFRLGIDLHKLIGDVSQIGGMGLIPWPMVSVAHVAVFKVCSVSLQAGLLRKQSIPFGRRKRLERYLRKRDGLDMLCV
ncbi:MAG: hypothetical protein A4E49_00482 [Methanosaeta sp. PtaU1.Bin112]|nr:MAG: hypothetical protein A4E49_00482 [Methanosaeta sp. PtaU1.Bin112]